MTTRDIEHRSALSEELVALRLRLKTFEAENAQLRKQVKRLRESEETFRTLFENTGTATVLLEEDMTISLANNEFQHFCGYRQAEIEHRMLWSSFICKEDLERIRTYHLRQRLKNHFVPRHYECRLINAAKQVRHCYITAVLIEQTQQSVVSFVDITETICANQVLRDFEEKFTKTFRASPDIITVSTLSEGRFLDVNDTFCKKTGYKREEIIGCTTDDLKFWPSPEYRNCLIKLLLENGKIQNKEIEFFVKSQKKRIGLMSAEIADLQGEVCMLSAFIDITRQRRLEKEILRIREIERRKIGHDLHDDLGQHLIGIMALSTLLEQRLEQTSGSEKMLSKEISKLIQDAIGKTRNLARGLCPVNIAENGFIPALCEFSIYVRKVFGVSCDLNYDEDLNVKNKGVATHLYHIVQEAVNNAVRHGKARHIHIFFKRLDEDGNEVILSIKDNGCGLSASSNHKKGLGLNIMHYRAKRIGAGFEVYCNTEGGTSVQCRLNPKSLS
jgi:PAS domain S-box-containing protein